MIDRYGICHYCDEEQCKENEMRDRRQKCKECDSTFVVLITNCCNRGICWNCKSKVTKKNMKRCPFCAVDWN